MGARFLPRMLATCGLILLALAAVLVLSRQLTHASPGATERVSVDSTGTQGNAASSWPPDISADGRYVAFESSASNLVSDDTNGKDDIFVHDRETGETTRVSVDSAGNEANGHSGDPAISADGRYVAFGSIATNLVPDDTNQCGYPGNPGTCADVFLRDRVAGTTTRVSVSTAGDQGNDESYYPSISADGRYIAFRSYASNLIPDDANEYSDIFLRDRDTGETTLVNVDSAGNQMAGFSAQPAISTDGRYVAFQYNMDYIHVRDRQAGTTELVSVNSDGVPGDALSENPAISADGRYIAFSSRSSNLVPGDTLLCPGLDVPENCDDIFVHDRDTGLTERVSVTSAGVGGNRVSERPGISADGRSVAFDSSSTNLVPNDTNASTDVFVHDRQTGETTRVSVDSAGDQGNSSAFAAAISADGRYVAFLSSATNLVPEDTNGYADIFVHDRGPLPPIPTPTPTSTPVPTPTPAPDSDSDGCVDPQEQAMGLDPLAWYDFYDVPVPPNPDMTPNGPKNRAVTMTDVLAVLRYFGAYDGDGGVPNGSGVAYDSVKGSCFVGGIQQKEGLCYDRSPGADPNPPRPAGPPNGTVTMADVLTVLAQFGLSCAGPP